MLIGLLLGLGSQEGSGEVKEWWINVTVMEPSWLVSQRLRSTEGTEIRWFPATLIMGGLRNAALEDVRK